MRSRSGASGEEGVLELDPGAGSGRRAVRRPQGDQAAGTMQKTSQSMRPKAGWETEALDMSRGRCQRQTGVGSGVQGGARAREPNAGQAELLSQLPGTATGAESQQVVSARAADAGSGLSPGAGEGPGLRMSHQGTDADEGSGCRRTPGLPSSPRG